jgi:8-oxo-dGTP diphosphatase
VNPRPSHHVAAAIVRRGEEIVLVLQGAPGEEPFWSLPGGVVDDGELVPEALVREVGEEAGLTIDLPLRLAFVRQVDSRKPVQLIGRRPGSGFLLTVWVFEADMWSGDVAARDPDGFVTEARFVPVADAIERLRRTSWLEVVADYLEGNVEPGSLRFERRHEDGRVEVIPA